MHIYNIYIYIHYICNHENNFFHDCIYIINIYIYIYIYIYIHIKYIHITYLQKKQKDRIMLFMIFYLVAFSATQNKSKMRLY